MNMDFPLDLEDLADQLYELRLHDATVYAFMKTAEVTGASELTMLRSLVVQLAKEKNKYFNMAVHATNMALYVPVEKK